MMLLNFIFLIPVVFAIPTTWFRESECGKSKYADAGSHELPSPSIVGGIQARPNEFPWQASLRRSSHFCGASIINERWLLTAAHCTVGANPSTLKVVLGEHARLESENAARQTLKIEKIIIHESYSNPIRYSNDFSLLKTTEAIKLNENVWPICAPKPEDKLYEHKKAIVSGWGTTSPGGLTTNNLLYTTVNTTTNEYCQSVYTKHTISPDMICASDNQGSTERDACQGDSGGPLAVKNADGTFSLIGVVSWGIGCASEYPGVYGRVSHVNDWILKVLAEN